MELYEHQQEAGRGGLHVSVSFALSPVCSSHGGQLAFLGSAQLFSQQTDSAPCLS